MKNDTGNSLLRLRFGIAPQDYSGPFVNIALPDRSGDLLLINTGATAAELEALREPARIRRRNITAWFSLALAASVFAAIWLAASGSAAMAWAAPVGTAVIAAAAGVLFYRAQGKHMVAEQDEAITATPALVRSPLLPGQGRRSLGAGIADHFQSIPEQAEDEAERQVRFEMAHWLQGYAQKYGTASESAGMVELMNAEASLKTLRSMQQERLAA